MISALTKANVYLKAFGISKIPLIYYCRPKITHYSEEKIEVKIPLSRRTKNHFGSMYFGAQAVGADVTGAFIAFLLAKETGKNIAIVFKDFKAEFLKRPDGDVLFSCHDGKLVKEMIAETIQTQERVNKTVQVLATVPEISEEVVAKFDLTLSLKYKP